MAEIMEKPAVESWKIPRGLTPPQKDSCRGLAVGAGPGGASTCPRPACTHRAVRPQHMRHKCLSCKTKAIWAGP